MHKFFQYFGAKHKSISRYPRPSHDLIVEPFAGSAAYATRHGAGKRVVLCDLDDAVCGVWDYLIRASEQDILSLPSVIVDSSYRDLDIPQEAKNLIGFWISVSPSRPCLNPHKWMRTHSEKDYRGRFWCESIKQRIASQLKEIRAWEIRNCSYADLDNYRAQWFIDPPYADKGYSYRCSGEGIDYGFLGAWCMNRSGSIIVCGKRRVYWIPMGLGVGFHGESSNRSNSKEVFYCR